MPKISISEDVKSTRLMAIVSDIRINVMEVVILNQDKGDENLLNNKSLINEWILNILTKEKIYVDKKLLKSLKFVNSNAELAIDKRSAGLAIEAMTSMATECRDKGEKRYNEYVKSYKGYVGNINYYRFSGPQRSFIESVIYKALANYFEEVSNKITRKETNGDYSESEVREAAIYLHLFGKKGGCYIATCVYGSYDCPELWTLRRFRDDTLSRSRSGGLFIRVYYKLSPKIVRLFGRNIWFNKLFKCVIDKLVAKLQNSGVDSSYYTDV